ncbi:MAG: acyl-CoA synthetase [Proteobacteria bacterium]|nr:acyl-CoA synthetase [Pseudomonadota bacterium]
MVQDNPNKPAFIMAGSGEVVTRLQLEERANQCARMLRALGLKNGDKIAIFMENNPQFLVICSGAARAGLIYTPISTHLTTPEVEYIINDSGAKVFFTSLAKSRVAVELTDKMPNVSTRLMVNGAVDGYESYEERMAAFPIQPIADEMSGKDMLYSSGTTGRPKGVTINWEELPYGELPPAALLLIGLYGLNENAVYLSPAPLYHAAPLRFVLLTMRAGGTVVVMEKFDALEAIRLIEKYKITHSQWVPTMFIRMLKLPEEERKGYDVSSQTIAIHAAAPIPISVKEQMIDWWGPILFEYYAGTESNGLCAIASQEWMTHKGSVGRAMLGVIKILDDDLSELPVGQVGTIYFADGQPFEYHNDPEKTAESTTAQGWTTLGDVGYLDTEGYLYLTDRKSNMIISGGVNIYPQESENVLVTHPRVLDVAVIGVPHEEFGEEVKGVVQLRNPAEASPELAKELIGYCRGRLAKIKCPVSVDFVEELPRTPTGKLLKRLLKDRYWQTG